MRSLNSQGRSGIDSKRYHKLQFVFQKDQLRMEYMASKTNSQGSFKIKEPIWQKIAGINGFQDLSYHRSKKTGLFQ